ncbi:MAG: fimbrial protein [Rhizobiaceae bacterium]|nr:fimbrial protein [Rhizobiaceae bacterium]MCV0407330.1 fimbrial protein [Rhizobiaceae bacterium]
MREEDDDKPLDPAVERVRRKLTRFVAINLGILFAALMAVAIALVYKGMVPPGSVETDIAITSPEGAGITLPRGARILSQSLSGSRLSIHVEHADGGQSILIYDLGAGRAAGSVPVVFE